MSSENELVRFLYDFPWTSQSVLEEVLGPRFKKLARTRETRTIEVPGVGVCWGIKQEKLSSVPGVRRREQAKKYLISRYGKDTLWNGASPGLWGSDLLAMAGKDRKFWLGVWVDNGGATVESLPFIRRGTERNKPGLVNLVITTTLERAELIKRQISARWRYGKESLLIYANEDEQYVKMNPYAGSSPGFPKGMKVDPIKIRAEITSQRWDRLNNIRHDQNIGKLFLDLREADFILLAYIGDNPHFSISDLAFLLSFGTTGNIGSDIEPGKKEAAVKKGLDRLVQLGLIESAATPLSGIKISSTGLEVLAKFWGISQESMRRFHAWPQKKGAKREIVYSENALGHIKDHTQKIQQFIFGLLDGAWRLQKPYGGVDIYLDTIVGKRIYFEDLATRKLDWLIPDAVVDLSFWRRIWRDGKVHEPKIFFSNSRLLIEFDRATNPITRLYERIRKYGRIWNQLSGNPVQIWIIDGTPWREKEVLEMLGGAGIPGWTVLVERLVLGKEDPWWEWYFRAEGNVPYQKHGGMAPLRKIWRNTKDYELHPLLGHSPWAQEMSLSKPMISVPRGY